MPGEFEDEIVSGVVRVGEETTTGTEVVTRGMVEVGVVTTEAVVGVDKEEVIMEQQLSARPWMPGKEQRAGDSSPFG